MNVTGSSRVGSWIKCALRVRLQHHQARALAALNSNIMVDRQGHIIRTYRSTGQSEQNAVCSDSGFLLSSPGSLTRSKVERRNVRADEGEEVWNICTHTPSATVCVVYCAHCKKEMIVLTSACGYILRSVALHDYIVITIKMHGIVGRA